MGQLKSLDLQEPETTPVRDAPRAPSSSSRAWIWFLVVVCIAVAGYWYYRAARSKEADTAAAPTAAKGEGRERGTLPFQSW
jgi:hypothetical protein